MATSELHYATVPGLPSHLHVVIPMPGSTRQSGAANELHPICQVSVAVRRRSRKHTFGVASSMGRPGVTPYRERRRQAVAVAFRLGAAVGLLVSCDRLIATSSQPFDRCTVSLGTGHSAGPVIALFPIPHGQGEQACS